MARHDPKGMEIFFDVSGPARVTRIVIDLPDDGQPGWEMNFGPQTDGRAVRALAVKPVVNGSFAFFVEATDARGCTVRQAGPDNVIVVSK